MGPVADKVLLVMVSIALVAVWGMFRDSLIVGRVVRLAVLFDVIASLCGAVIACDTSDSARALAAIVFGCCLTG
jgi:hypothetical protein